MLDSRDPKIIKEEAAGKIAELLREHVAVIPIGAEAGIIRMFARKWPELRQAAHQLHAAIEAERTHVEPARPIDGVGGPVSHNDPVIVNEKRLREVLQPIRNRMDGIDHEGENVKRRLDHLEAAFRSRLDNTDFHNRIVRLEEAQAKTTSLFKRLGGGD